jgi:hypothetical protein
MTFGVPGLLSETPVVAELGELSELWDAAGGVDGDGDVGGDCAHAVDNANPLTAVATISFLIISAS